jgi:hypothetical protein
VTEAEGEGEDDGEAVGVALGLSVGMVGSDVAVAAAEGVGAGLPK